MLVVLVAVWVCGLVVVVETVETAKGHLLELCEGGLFHLLWKSVVL